MKRQRLKRQRSDVSGQEGFTLVYMAVVMTGLLLFSGLAVDSGRAYVVKAQLTKAVDGAALGAARALNSGDPAGEAARIFKANFPPGYMGTSSVTDPTTSLNFYHLTTNAATGVNVVTITATAALPTTFMKLGQFNSVTVGSSGEATRRMVDLSLVIDVSGSIGAQWGAVRDASREFIRSFDAVHDRLALMTFSNGATVLDAMPAARGFNKNKLVNDVPNGLPGGSTLMVEGLYRGWDELRTVPAGQQSGLRIIVLFTDGASNGVPGKYDVSPGTAKSLRTADFPKNLPDPDGMTWAAPALGGLADTETGVTNAANDYSVTPLPDWHSTTTIPQVQWLPLTTWHTHGRSGGIPTQYQLQTAGLNVNGVPQNARRGLLGPQRPGTNQYPATIINTNNAARNVLEMIANDARNDNGDYKIRIYTIGMGALVNYNLGSLQETSASVLRRISNDKLPSPNPDHNPAQLDGQYFFAATAANVSAAYQGIQNQILRLSK